MFKFCLILICFLVSAQTFCVNDFFTCVKEEDVDTIINHYFPKEGFDKTIRGGDGLAVLHWAIIYWKSCSLEKLLHYEVALTTKTPMGETPLMLAAAYGNYDAVAMLIKKGASIHDVRASDGSNALSHAHYNGHIDCAELLKMHGATMGVRPQELSLFPMHNNLAFMWDYCVQRCNYEGIKNCRLLYGFVPSIDQYYEALRRASKEKNLELVKMLHQLIKGASEDTLPKKIKNTIGALLVSPIDTVQLYAEKSPEILEYSFAEQKTKVPTLASHIVAQYKILEHFTDKNSSMLEVYKKHGKKLKLPTFILNVVLDDAIANNDIVGADYLLFCGASATSKALLLAAEQGSPDLVELLLKYGAKIDSDNNGVTALYTSILNENYAVATFLLEKKASTSKKLQRGLTYLHLALHVGDNHELVAQLLKHGANPNAVWPEDRSSVLAYAVYKNRVASSKVLLAAGASYSFQMSDEDILMDLFVSHDQQRLQIFKYVLFKGASLDYDDYMRNMLFELLEQDREMEIPLTRLLACRHALLYLNTFDNYYDTAFLLGIFMVHANKSFNYWPSLVDFCRKSRKKGNKACIQQVIDDLIDLNCECDWSVLVDAVDSPCDYYEYIQARLKKQAKINESEKVTGMLAVEKIRHKLTNFVRTLQLTDAVIMFP